jgi:hypothetical protein
MDLLPRESLDELLCGRHAHLLWGSPHTLRPFAGIGAVSCSLRRRLPRGIGSLGLQRVLYLRVLSRTAANLSTIVIIGGGASEIRTKTKKN